MVNCLHHDICGLSDEYDVAAGLCILHSKKPDKDPQDFDEALETQQIQNRNIFRHMVFPKEVNFGGITFEESTDFKGTTFNGDAYFGGATFERNVHFIDAVFKNVADFSGATFEKVAYFTHTTFEKESKFDGATFENIAHFGRSKFKGRAGFNLTTFCRESFFGRAIFKNVADFREATFEKVANFFKARFNGVTYFNRAYLVDANMEDVCLKGADFTAAHLEQATFVKANLCGVRAQLAVVDGATLFTNCEIDEKTDFEGVGLDSARIDSRLKVRLKYNIRRHHWEAWYERHRVLQWPSRLFWWTSDYGSSMPRLIGTFAIVSLFFTLLYLLPTIPAPTGSPEWWPFAPSWWPTVEHSFLEGLDAYKFERPDGTFGEIPLSFYRRLLRAGYFSVVTMTTLGFGDIHAHPMSPAGQLLVMLQVLIGYVLLGALITRLAILFREVE